MKSLHIALLGAAALALSGCYKIDYINGPSDPYPASSQWHHIGILGLVEFSNPVALHTICPNGWGKVHNERSFLNGLVSYIVGNGLYSPYTVEVHCASGQAYRVNLNEDGLATSAEPL